MKNKLLVILILALPASIRAQYSMDFESGNRGIEQGNCWVFGAVGYINNSERISGGWSARSNSMSNPALSSSWIKTPWMIWQNGNISFDARLINNTGSTKFIALSFLPYDADVPAHNEGTSLGAFYIYDFVQIAGKFSTSVNNISVPVPAAVVDGKPYKLMVSFGGTGGNNRAVTDNYVFPATYWADPSNNCVPLPTGVPPIADADGDGVADGEDDFPNDPNLAFANYFPGDKNTYGTLAFEDMWPFMGDYDFNDLVVDYQAVVLAKADNRVQRAQIKLYVRAAGAEMRSGFGIEITGLNPGNIASVSGHVLKEGYINIAPNGTELGQTHTVIIPFDNYENVINRQGTWFYNTSPNDAVANSDTVVMDLIFTGVITVEQLNQTSFNPFLIRNRVRSMEIHLPSMSPTDKADKSQIDPSRYYRTSNNLPWALNIPSRFEYPKEQEDILGAYLNFANWAQSGGQLNKDWYLKLPGNTDESKLFNTK